MTKSERATSLAGCRPLCPICRRSGTAPGWRQHDRGPVRNLRAEPALPSLLRDPRRKSFITSIFPVAWHEYRCRSSQMSVVGSLLWKIALPLVLIIVRKPPIQGTCKHFSVWKWRPDCGNAVRERIGLIHARPLPETKRHKQRIAEACLPSREYRRASPLIFILTTTPHRKSTQPVIVWDEGTRTRMLPLRRYAAR